MGESSVVVVGVDFEAAGDEAIRAALRERAADPAQTLVFVFALEFSDLPDAFGEDEFDTEDEALERAALLLRRRIDRIASADRSACEARVRVLPRAGKPIPVLLKACGEFDAELLIVGTHARRGLDRIMLGSVAETLVREAPCPVLVARPRRGPGGALTASEVMER